MSSDQEKPKSSFGGYAVPKATEEVPQEEKKSDVGTETVNEVEKTEVNEQEKEPVELL